MGTRWRGLIAQINVPTGDGRRMAPGAFRSRELPLPVKWQRCDEDGHEESIVVGSMDTLNIDESAAEVWGEGEVFDDQPQLERLTADVAEAMLLVTKGVIGPSVDAGAATAIFVEPGMLEPITEDRWDELMWESLDTGEDPQIDLLFTDYEIAGVTLVMIPAFAGVSFELSAPAALTAAVIGSSSLPIASYDAAWDGQAAMGRVFDANTAADGTVDTAAIAKAFLYRDDAADPATKGAYKLGFADIINGEMTMVPVGVQSCAGGHGVDAATIPAGEKDQIKRKICQLYDACQQADEQMPDCPFGNMMASTTPGMAVALIAAASPIPAEVFDDPQLTQPTPITVEDRGEGFLRVYGMVAAGGVCHVGIRDVCYTAPTSATGYVPFHRYPQNTTAGLVATGRITTGLGRAGTGCTHLSCRGKDDHACEHMSLGDTLAHYDKLTTLAYGRVGHNERGDIWFAGIAEPDLSAAAIAVLNRQRFSGHWYDVGGQLELVEVLALSTEQPGFPVPSVVLTNGRQRALVAAGTVRPRRAHSPAQPGLSIDYPRLASEVAAALRDQGISAAGPAPTAQVLTATGTHTSAMIALRMTEQDAQRLAVPGGEPADELHLTLAFLGAAADIAAETQQAILDAMGRCAQALSQSGAELSGDAFSVSAFNPADAERETAIVLGLGGEQLATVQVAVTAALGEVFTAPDQYLPWAAHITLQYSDDLALVEAYADRTGAPVTFDRLRVAFAGVATDFPITATPAATAAAELAAQVEQTLDAIEQDQRAAETAQLLAELEDADVLR